MKKCVFAGTFDFGARDKCGGGVRGRNFAQTLYKGE